MLLIPNFLHGGCARARAGLAAATGLLLVLASSSSLALDVDLEVNGNKPEEACLNTEKTMRMVMNVWANGATDTYAQIRPDLEKGLKDQGERGAKVLPVFQEIMPRIESGEFLPPKVISRYEGHQKLRAATHALCMQALKG